MSNNIWKFINDHPYLSVYGGINFLRIIFSGVQGCIAAFSAQNFTMHVFCPQTDFGELNSMFDKIIKRWH